MLDFNSFPETPGRIMMCVGTVLNLGSTILYDEPGLSSIAFPELLGRPIMGVGTRLFSGSPILCDDTAVIASWGAALIFLSVLVSTIRQHGTEFAKMRYLCQLT
jgi:hypothetical protein